MTDKTSPLISVLMTVYNREEYIAEAIASVINSTYKNWELIIVDDRSTDNSLNIAHSYKNKDKRIHVYLNEKNLGDYPNRNKAASYAKGKYLKYVDADDMIYPYGLEQLVFFMEQFPDAGFGLCSIEQDAEKIFPFELKPRDIYLRHFVHKKSVFHKAPLSSVIKRSVFEKVNGFANVRHYGDFEMWLRLSKSYNLVLMPHGIVWYRVTDGQEASIRKKNPMNAFNTINAGISHVKSKDCPLSAVQKERVALMFQKQIASLILFNYRKGKIIKANELKAQSGLNLLKILKLKFFN